MSKTDTRAPELTLTLEPDNYLDKITSIYTYIIFIVGYVIYNTYYTTPIHDTWTLLLLYYI
jgi:hypothetical protein